MRIDQLPVASSITNNDTLPVNVSGTSQQLSIGFLTNAIRDNVYGAPLTASTSSSMTDQTRVYVYTGTTGGGFTNGHWYYYNGSAWTDGGAYNSSAVTTDTTLTLSGVPADAAATGVAVSILDGVSKTNEIELSNGTLSYPTYTWEQGTLNSSGNVSNSKVIRTAEYIPIAGYQRILIDIPAGHMFGIYYYTSTQAYSSRSIDIAQSSVLVAPSAAAYFRVLYYTNPLAAITPDHMPKPVIRTMTGAAGAYDIYPTGTTANRTPEIRMSLSLKGICRFAPGDYYIGSLNMYENCKLIGAGNATRLIKNIDDGTHLYAIKAFPGCEIASLQLIGQEETLTPTEVGTIDGILIQGSGSSDSQRWRSNIHDVTILDCTGAGIHFEQTGYNPQAGCHISNVFIRQCGIGIRLGQYAEYHRVVDAHCNGCYIGILNNGGNNVITNSDFSSNTRGIVMDNTNDDMPNNSHGAFVACTVNHNNNNTGTAIEVIGMHSGEIFSGLNIFYGGVTLTNSSNIQFNGCKFGSATPIVVSANSNLVLFNGCIFKDTDSVSGTSILNSKTHFINCYLHNGTVYDPTV